MPHYSYSRVKLWRHCHMAHYYRYVLRLAKKRKAIPLFRGTILHEMLNARAILKLHPKAPHKSPEQILSGYAKKYRIMLKEEQGMYGDVIGDLRRIFNAYERYYEKEEYTVVASEDPILTTLKDDIKFVGYIDKRVKDDNDQMWIKDHKSCSSIPDDDTRFSDYQLILYPWAWNKDHPGQEVSGIIWDYVRTKPPTIPELLKKGGLTKRMDIDTDHHTYLDTIYKNDLNPKHYKEILTHLKNKKSTFFRRIVLPIPPKRTVDTIVTDFRTSVMEIESLSKTDSGKIRSMTYNCKQCEFYQLCQAEIRGLDSDFIRKTDYIEREPEEHSNAEES